MQIHEVLRVAKYDKIVYTMKEYEGIIWRGYL
jgi:hypothetical protein